VARWHGAVVALQDRCPHRGAPLSKGRIEDGTVRCMYHGLKFDTHGKCVQIPAQDRIPPAACVNKFTVVERNKWIWIWMGEAALADPLWLPGGAPGNLPDRCLLPPVEAVPKWSLRLDTDLPRACSPQ